jgi:phosphomannomutase
MASGCDVIDVGIAPTPTVGRAVPFHQAAGGVQITASHNPSPWNGLKLFGPDGAVLSADEGRAIQALYDARQFRRAEWDGIRGTSLSNSAIGDHRRRVSELVDVAAIRQRKPRVLLDPNRGAGGPLGVTLLADLGCEVVPWAAEPDGRFEHEPEPIPENLDSGSASSVARSRRTCPRRASSTTSRRRTV